MPAPAVYVLAVVGTVGAVIAFKEFIYEPHIAPRFEKWKAEYVARREARRRQRHPVPVPVSVPLRRRGSKHSDSTESDSDDDDARRTYNLKMKKSSSGSNKRQALIDSIELDLLVAREMREWRNQTDRAALPERELRRRKNVGSHLEDSFNSLPHSSLTPSTIKSPMSTTSSPAHASPKSISHPTPGSPGNPTVRSESTSLTSSFPSTSHMGSESELLGMFEGIPPPNINNSSTIPGTLVAQARVPTLRASPSPPFLASPQIPSLSQSYPQDLDHEHGLELVSPPSSRADTPFTSVSASVSAVTSPRISRSQSPTLSATHSQSDYLAFETLSVPLSSPQQTFHSFPSAQNTNTGTDSDTFHSFSSTASSPFIDHRAPTEIRRTLSSPSAHAPSPLARSISSTTLSASSSTLSSPVQVSISPPHPAQTDIFDELSALSSPSPVTFTSPPTHYANIPSYSYPSSPSPSPSSNPMPHIPMSNENNPPSPYPASPFSPHRSDLSELDFLSDFDEQEQQHYYDGRSESGFSDSSWASGESGSASGRLNARNA